MSKGAVVSGGENIAGRREGPGSSPGRASSARDKLWKRLRVLDRQMAKTDAEIRFMQKLPLTHTMHARLRRLLKNREMLDSKRVDVRVKRKARLIID